MVKGSWRAGEGGIESWRASQPRVKSRGRGLASSVPSRGKIESHAYSFKYRGG